MLECVYVGSHADVVNHLTSQHPQVGGNAASAITIYPFFEIRAFRGYLRTYRHRLSAHQLVSSPQDYFQEVEVPIKTIIRINTEGRKAIKVQVTLLSEFIRGEVDSAVHETCVHYIHSRCRIINSVETFDEFFFRIKDDINGIVEIFEEHGSGWKFRKAMGSDIRIAKYKPRRGRCAVPLTYFFKRKGALINVLNKDDQCFKWAFLSIKHYKDIIDHRNRVSKYRKYVKKYNWKGIKFPAELNDVIRFEKQNEKHKIAINVFEADDDDHDVDVLRISPNCMEEGYETIDLLLYHDRTRKLSHYVGIVNISKLYGKRNYHKKLFCYNCQNLFGHKILKEHTISCKNFKTQRVTVPKCVNGVKPVIRFKDYYKALSHDYILYCDFECLMKTPDKINVSDNTENLFRHEPSGFFIALVGTEEGLVDYYSYRGEKCIEMFFSKLDSMCHRVKDAMNLVEDMRLTAEEQEMHDEATHCYICNFPFTDNQKKSRDHNHRSGEFNGSSHVACNMGFSLKRRRIPCYIHNLGHYDLHLILGGFKYFKGEITVIPNNFEQYISVFTSQFMLLDSIMFLNSSLDSLVNRLKTSGESFDKTFKNLIQYFGKDNAKLLCRKGIYFYEYIKDFKMFEETEFPSRDSFYNSLTEESISLEDYCYGRMIYKKFCKTLGCYHDLYNAVDTLLLADVMEHFRRLTIKFYSIDPGHYFTLSSFTWDAALKMTGAQLENLTSIQMYQMFEGNLRGGVSMITQRYAKSNNKYLKNYNVNKPSSYILSLDCNNLYGKSLRSFLPISDFKFMKRSQINKITTAEIMQWNDEAPTGYVLMVDLKYPSKLHMRDSDYPLAPDRLKVLLKQFSPFQNELLEHLGLKYNEKNTKLVPHLGSRKRYVVHYRILKFYLEKGMVLKKIRKVISFHQEPWLRPYIDFNTQQRQEATDQFAKDLFKFLINACFGKSCENLRKRKKVHICNTVDQARHLINNHNFRRFEIINSKVVIVEMAQKVIELNKAIYTGFTCLEIANLIMYEFHMNTIKERYGDKATLLQTDTDNLNYIIETEDVYKDMQSMGSIFDFSDYDKSHFLYSDVNKKVLGKFKDESAGIPVQEFCGLSPKMYSFIGEGIWKKAAKGIKKSTINRSVMHSTFKKVLFKHKKLKTKMNLIRSTKHVLHTMSLTKTGIHPFDTKRWILPDGFKTLPHFHFLIKRYQK